ncbi:hypothetical protein [Sinimarinibacterium sp. CAU 1509]|uniref:hypothetical protein n=1 Tax=Sinimarinibacterium sp. CAU 1509 TaxID=2562283 RepID=UPI00146B4BDC|nr:hypothetical protein [Sinimarinibacterium sp. CAU 1509]
MARPNYGFDKRQREIKKNQKQEEKRLKKLAAREGQPEDGVTEAAPASTAEVIKETGGE